MFFLPLLLLQTEPPIPGWTSKVYVKGWERGSEHRKGPLIINATTHTFTSSCDAKNYDRSHLSHTNAAQDPIKSWIVEATGLRLFEFPSTRHQSKGKWVLDPLSSKVVHGAIGNVAYWIRVKVTEDGRESHPISRKHMIRETEKFVPRFVAVAKPSPVRDSRTFSPNIFSAPSNRP
jgi:hypothetical protein